MAQGRDGARNNLGRPAHGRARRAAARLVPLAGSVASVAVVTGMVAVLQHYGVPVLSLGILYVFAVLLAAVAWGLPYALGVAAASMLVYDQCCLPSPYRSLTHPHTWLTLSVNAVTAIVVSTLAARARRRADVSEEARGRLEGEQAALRRVATLVARGVPPATVFSAVVEEAGRLLDADVAHLERYAPDGSARVVAGWDHEDGCSTAEAGGVSHGSDRLSSAGCPIVVEGRPWGVLVVSFAGGDPLPESTQRRLSEFAALVATAISNSQARAELEASRLRIVAAADEARRRIERDLHDGIQQQLVSLTLELRAAEDMIPPELPELHQRLLHTVDGLVAALDNLRELSRGIHPAILAQGGVALALKGLARRSALPVELDLRTDRRFPDHVEVAAYYVVSESLANAAKHAKASAVSVALSDAGGRLVVSVEDDGVGGADPARGSGLRGLADRVEALGGRITVRSPVGKGTSIVVELPVE